MPRNLAPRNSLNATKPSKGSLVFLPDPSTKTTSGSSYPTLVFQYNPETVTRTRAGEWKKDRAERDAGAMASASKSSGTKDQDTTMLDGHRGGGLYAESETIQFKLTFDATELQLAKEDESLGILPELGWLEQAALGSEQSAKKDKERKEQRPSELLLILGQRVFPVVVTSLNITEQRFDKGLAPVRAEIDIKFRVLEAGEVKGNARAQQAFVQLVTSRRTLADKASTTTADSAIASALSGKGGST